MKKSLFLLLLLSTFCPSWGGELNFSEIGQVAIQDGGRKKPLDTFASESFQMIYGRRALKDPKTEKYVPALDSLLSMWCGKTDWKSSAIILVPDAALRREMSLDLTRTHFSLVELQENTKLIDHSRTIDAKHSRREDLNALETEAEVILIRMQQLENILRGRSFTVVPNPEKPKGNWFTLQDARSIYGESASAKITQLFGELSGVYLNRNNEAFSLKSQQFRAALEEFAPGHYPSIKETGVEIHYNHTHPFRWSWIFYGISFFLLLVPSFRRLAVFVFGLGLVMHIYGLGLRSWIGGRAPVTNMYESVVWVSLGVAAFAWIFTLIYKGRTYLLSAAPLAILGLILADNFPAVLNPRIGPLPPVLRDNFWLTTHVLTITLGYAAFGLAMGFGHVILIRYLVKPKSVGDDSPLYQMLYRVLQIGVLLLAAGTILGGVWANYSWGRFWGWDPKETWALIALLVYIFALHGRFAGWWKNFGLSVWAVVGFSSIIMAWYGVNFVLGKGLHSYGFGGGGGVWIGSLVAVDLVFVGICIAARYRNLSLKLA
jgi:cytochrome c-type biogenesis protein CcsB